MRPGGAAVQLRDKERSGGELVALGRALRAITRAAGAPLLVNGRLDVARIVEADGVHLPESGVTAQDARRLLGADAIVGRSCHDAAGVARADAEGATYAVLGPIGPVPGKGAPLPLGEVAAIARGARTPLLALGGVTPDSVVQLTAAGLKGVAVVRTVYDAEVPGERLADLRRRLDGTPGEG